MKVTVIDGSRVFEKETDYLPGAKDAKAIRVKDVKSNKVIYMLKKVVPKKYWIEKTLISKEIVVSYNDSVTSGVVEGVAKSYDDSIIGKVDTKQNRMEYLEEILVEVDTAQ